MRGNYDFDFEPDSLAKTIAVANKVVHGPAILVTSCPMPITPACWGFYPLHAGVLLN